MKSEMNYDDDLCWRIYRDDWALLNEPDEPSAPAWTLEFGGESNEIAVKGINIAGLEELYHEVGLALDQLRNDSVKELNFFWRL